MTSLIAPVREGMKVWCHSSKLATRADIEKAIAAQRSAHRGVQGKRSVARQARNRKKLKVKYPTK